MISWALIKQPIVSISSTKAEYVAVTFVDCQVIWMRRLLNDLSHVQKDPTPMLFDNNFSIALLKNHVFHKNIKHIHTHFHFIWVLVNNGDIFLDFCGSQDYLVDIFTKPLGKNIFKFQRENLGIVCSNNCNS